MIRLMLIALHLLLGIAALGAGQALVRRPSGADLTFSIGWLERSPFPDYRIPGLVMVLVIAPMQLLAFWSQLRGRAEAPALSMTGGVFLVLWLILQTAIIGYRHWSQLIWAILFPLTAVLGFMQGNQRHHE
jgi:hypothetical protein